MLTGDASAISRLSLNLKRYVELSKRDVDETLNRKGNDLRIQLFKLYWSQRWAKGDRTAPFTEFRERAAMGKGIKVRSRMLLPSTGNPPKRAKNKRPLSRWQQLVWQELKRRAKGIGVLGVTFLMKRWRYRKEGRYIVENRTRNRQLALRIIRDDRGFTLVGFTPGLAKVGSRHGILERAMNAVSRDMEPYIARKLSRNSQRVLASN